MDDDLFTQIELEIVQAMDEVTLKYWTPELVIVKPGSYVKEFRKVIRDVLEKHINEPCIKQ